MTAEPHFDLCRSCIALWSQVLIARRQICPKTQILRATAPLATLPCEASRVRDQPNSSCSATTAAITQQRKLPVTNTAPTHHPPKTAGDFLCRTAIVGNARASRQLINNNGNVFKPGPNTCKLCHVNPARWNPHKADQPSRAGKVSLDIDVCCILHKAVSHPKSQPTFC